MGGQPQQSRLTNERALKEAVVQIDTAGFCGRLVINNLIVNDAIYGVQSNEAMIKTYPLP